MNNNNPKFPPASAALILLLTAFLPSAMANSLSSTGVLFLAYDQGESNAFIRIQHQLDKRNIPYKIIAFGRAGEIFNNHPSLLKIKGLFDEPSIGHHREQAISDQILQQTLKSNSAKIIYSGMSSKAQAQLMNAYSEQDSLLIAFYDNFDPVASKSYVQPFLNEIITVNAFHLPSDVTASSFATLQITKQAEMVVTGQPALEDWDEIFEHTDASKLRQALEIPTTQPVFLFAGGHADDYPDSFQIFLKATKRMPEALFLVTYHPKYSGELERKLIESEATTNVRVIHKDQASTPELSTIASAVIVHKSTIAQQALYKGKPVIYIANDQFSNFILDKQLAKRIYSPVALEKELKALQKSGQDQFASLKPLGTPDNASQRIADLLEDFLKKGKSDE